MSAAAIDGALWLIGCGNMGGAMLRRWLACGLDPARVTVVNRSGGEVAPGIVAVRSLPDAPEPPAIVLLAVKPQQLDLVAPAVAPLLGEATLLVSILAGVEIAALRRRFPRVGAVVRAMPNTPVGIGQGVVALAGEDGDDARAERLMAPLGLVEWVDEGLFDAVTALAGSGPAFVFRFVDALAAAGADAGLPPDQAARLALATVAGAGMLAAQTDESPHALAERVASPGGSTRRGLDVLDAGDALRPLLRETLTAAILRNRELAAAAR